MPLPGLRAAYRNTWAVNDRIITEIGDPDAPVERNGVMHDLRWAMLAVIGETRQHTGHGDIIREQIDGRTGR